jgi:transposase
MLVGIDVAKAELVIGTRPAGGPAAERWAVANDERGVRTLVERLARDAPELIVLEATATSCSPSPRSRPPRCRWWS